MTHNVMSANAKIKHCPQQSSGWLAKLSLSFADKINGKGENQTVLVDRTQTGPLTLQRPFYPEGKPCHLYLLHPPGGIVGGDMLELDVNLTPHTHLVMTMPGATKFYRTAEHYASLHQTFNVDADSVLEWLPQDNIIFSAAKADIKTVINLQPSSKLLGWECLCLGRPTMAEKFDYGEVKSHLAINIPNRHGLNEYLKIISGDCTVIGHYAYSATLFAYPANEMLLTLARQTIANSPFPAGATCLDNLLMIRLLANDNLTCQYYLHELWRVLRPTLLNIPACPPRIWTT